MKRLIGKLQRPHGLKFHQNRVLLFATFIALAIIVTACQNQDDPVIEPQSLESRTSFSAADIPEVIDVLTDKMNNRKSPGEFSLFDGEVTQQLNIDWDRILQLVDSTGNETYTFRIESQDDDFTVFYNLILKFNSDQIPSQPYLLKYTMDDDFALEYAETYSMKNFRGTVQKLFLNEQNSNGSYSAAFGKNDVDDLSTDPCYEIAKVTNQTSEVEQLCEVFVIETSWYQCYANGQVCIYTHSDYEIVTECPDSAQNSGNLADDPCNPKDDVSPVLPPEAPTCPETEALQNDSEFKLKMGALRSNTSLNRETGYIIKDGEYEYKEGQPNVPGMDQSITEPIDGLIHSHYEGTAPSFTPDDILGMYQLYSDGNIKNTQEFFIGMVSFHGTSYLIMIDDEDTFDSWGKATLGTASLFKDFNDTVLTAFQINLASRPMIDSYEIALLAQLKDSGLKLYKGNAKFSKWRPRVIGSTGWADNAKNCD